MDLNTARSDQFEVVPTGWELTSLGAVCQIFGRIGFRGYTVDDIVDEGKGAIAINPSNIQNEVLDLSNCTYVSWEKYEQSPEIKINVGDILLVKTGSSFGKTAIVKSLPEKATLNPQVVVLKRARVDQVFLSYVMAFPIIQQQIASKVVGGALPTLSQKQMAMFTFPAPIARAEQEAIGEALSDADGLIESLEQLLAKKRQIKRGAIQDMVTGKKRLPGFSGQWELKRLDDLASIRSGGTPSTTQPKFWGGNVPWCTPSDVTSLEGKYLSETLRTITGEGLKASSAEIVPARSVLMTSRATIGECAINTIPVTTNQGFKNFAPFVDVDVEFLYYLLQMQTQDFISLCGGSTFLEISKSQLASFNIKLPTSKGEQSAIAAVLCDMDDEICALQTKLTKARQLKQGMMQELLTGRIRLV